MGETIHKWEAKLGGKSGVLFTINTTTPPLDR